MLPSQFYSPAEPRDLTAEIGFAEADAVCKWVFPR